MREKLFKIIHSIETSKKYMLLRKNILKKRMIFHLFYDGKKIEFLSWLQAVVIKWKNRVIIGIFKGVVATY